MNLRLIACLALIGLGYYPGLAAAQLSGVTISQVSVMVIGDQRGGHVQNFVEIAASNGMKGHAGPMTDVQSEQLVARLDAFQDKLRKRDVMDTNLNFANLWSTLYPANPLSSYLDGKDPLTGGNTWGVHRTARQTPTGAVINAFSAVDIALWDLRGKVMNQPVYKLLGGTRNSVPIYFSFWANTPAAALAAATNAYATFHQIKTFPPKRPSDGAAGLQANLAIAAAMRNGLPADAEISFDLSRLSDEVDASPATRGARLEWACEMVKGFEQYRPKWVEEPVGPDDIEGFAAIRKAAPNVKISAGEHLYSRWNLKPYLDRHLLDIVQVDPEWGGGISELVEICKMIQQSYPNVLVYPHGHEYLAAAHIMASQPLAVLGKLEDNKGPRSPEMMYFTNGGLTWTSNTLVMPAAPGLGLDLDPARYKVIKTYLGKALSEAIGVSAALEAPTLSIVTESRPGKPAEHGMEKMLAALKEKHVSFETAKTLDEAKGRMLMVAGLAGDQELFTPSLKGFLQSVPTNAESLAIQKLAYKGKPVWAIAGSDDGGLMYAELDVADRVGWGTNAESPLSEVRDAVEKPGVGTRGITLFAMNRAYWESRFYDEAYWQRYFDMLARNRFNSIAVLFGYENGGFLSPSYPYFFDVPEFPEVKMIGITAAQQKQNVEAFHRLIEMAHARGIKFTVGLWEHIYRGGVQNGGVPEGDAGLRGPTPNLVWGLTGENLMPYTQAAMKVFLKQFPGIDGIQFRMHDESGLKPGEQTGFWKAVFKTIMETTPKMPLELRAKGLTAAEIRSAQDAGVSFRVSTKYWMEQMGLPFHPTHVNPQDQGNRRHGYGDLLVYPQPYKVNWQLWNGGTTRIFLWGDPEYARRFADSTHLYDGDRFELDEPLATKMEAQPHDMKPFELLNPSARYYDYEFERYWHLFQVFGRIGYNTNTPSEIWDHEFENRFGPQTGPILEKALHKASWILPRIIASCYPYTGFPMTTAWVEKQHMGDLPSYAKAALSDVQLFESFDGEAQLLITNGETAKVRPPETSRWLAQTAAEVSVEVAEAEKEAGAKGSKEFSSTVIDLKMLAGMARYYSERIPAAVNYRLYDRTKDPRALDEAIAHERGAIAGWRQMVDAAGDTYAGDLMFGARSRNLCGHWRDELVSLERGLARLEDQAKSAPTNLVSTPAPHYDGQANSGVPNIVHQPILSAPAQKPLTIRVTVNSPVGIKWVQVFYRSVDQTKDYETLALKPMDEKGDYEAVIPADKLNPRFDFMYFIEVMDKEHRGAMFPDFNKQTPYFVVRLERGQ